MIRLKRRQRLLEQAWRRSHLGEFRRAQLIEVHVERLAWVDPVLDPVDGAIWAQ
jgi:hypothetical protein